MGKAIELGEHLIQVDPNAEDTGHVRRSGKDSPHPCKPKFVACPGEGAQITGEMSQG